MAAPAAVSRDSWQTVLKQQILQPVLESYEKHSQSPNAEKRIQQIIVWSLTVLGKGREYLDAMKPLNPEKVQGLFVSAIHHEVKKVAKEYFNQLSFQQRCNDVMSMLKELVQDTPLAAQMEENELDPNISTEADGDREVIFLDGSTTEKMELLKKWIENPSLVVPVDVTLPGRDVAQKLASGSD